MQNPNEKENEKPGADCQTSPFATSFLFVGKKVKIYLKRKGINFPILSKGLAFKNTIIKDLDKIMTSQFSLDRR